MNFVVTTPPATEPVSLDEMKAHLREDLSDQDALITSLIQAAREHCESFQNRAFITQTIKLYLDSFPTCPIRLPKPPLVSVTSIKYLDENGAQQTLATTEYQIVAESEPAIIVTAYGKVWPTTRAQASAIVIEYVAGYGTATAVPAAVKAAMKLLVGHWYENREAVNLANYTTAALPVPMAAESLLWMNRVVPV